MIHCRANSEMDLWGGSSSFLASWPPGRKFSIKKGTYVSPAKKNKFYLQLPGQPAAYSLLIITLLSLIFSLSLMHSKFRNGSLGHTQVMSSNQTHNKGSLLRPKSCVGFFSFLNSQPKQANFKRVVPMTGISSVQARRGSVCA